MGVVSITLRTRSGDIGRFEDITKLNAHQCLYALSFMKDKAELEARQIKSKFNG